MVEHFEQTVNETVHLEEMERRGGHTAWIDRFFAYHLVLVYYWIMVAYFALLPRYAYHLNSEVELHASVTYAKYLVTNPDDQKIIDIMNDELHHYQELILAYGENLMGIGQRFKKLPPPPDYVTREEVQEMIDAAIRRHNRNASIISMCVGWVVLALFAEGLLRLIGVIPPLLPWLKITL